MIISFVLMTLMCDSGVMLNGEIFDAGLFRCLKG